ncbi:MAG: SufE family protein [Myxococcales bacterium]|nr:SufE family protein [Myxococcales bacterium]
MNMTVDEIVENFELLDDWDERYQYIIDLGKKLPRLPEDKKVESALVPGCISRVWLHSHVEPDGTLRFEADSDAIIVRGLVSIVLALHNGQTAADILALDLSELFDRLNLGNQLSANRRNGFVSMLGTVRAFAESQAR